MNSDIVAFITENQLNKASQDALLKARKLKSFLQLLESVASEEDRFLMAIALDLAVGLEQSISDGLDDHLNVV